MHLKGRVKRALILFYSGSGGTRVVAEVLKEQLQEHGLKVEIKGVDSSSILSMSNSDLQGYLSGFDILVFGCPVYRMVAAKPMRDFVARIARFDEPMRAYVFMTKTAVSGDAVLELSEILRERNVVVGGFGEIIAPNTDLNVAIKMKRKKDEKFGLFRNFSSSIFYALLGGGGARRLVQSMAVEIYEMLLSQEIRVKRPRRKIISGIFWWWAQVNYLDEGEERFHQIKLRKEECHECKKCIIWRCTQNAWIEEDGQAVFKRAKCVGCQMCVNRCPNMIVVSEQQVSCGTIFYPRLTRKFYKDAKIKFFSEEAKEGFFRRLFQLFMGCFRFVK